MNIIRCMGTNDNNLHPEEFKKLFLEECQKEGVVVNFVFNPKQCFAEAVKQ